MKKAGTKRGKRLERLSQGAPSREGDLLRRSAAKLATGVEKEVIQRVREAIKGPN